MLAMINMIATPQLNNKAYKLWYDRQVAFGMQVILIKLAKAPRLSGAD